MKKLGIDGALNEMLNSIGDAKSAMPSKKNIGYVVFHSGTEHGTVPFYLTKSRVAFSAGFEVAEIFNTEEEADKVMREMYAKMQKSASPVRNYLGVGRIDFEVVEMAVQAEYGETKGVLNDKLLATVLGNEDGRVEVVYLEGFCKFFSDVFAIPQNKTVRIRCGKESNSFYEVDCESGDFAEWIEHLEEKNWYTGELRRVANEHIRHFCKKWGCR